MTTRPAEALDTSITGTRVSLFTTGQGRLDVTPFNIRPRSRSTVRKSKPPFKAVSREVNGLGVEEIDLKLSRKAQKKLNKKNRLKLALSISFTAVDGETISKVEKAVVTQRCKPTKERVC